VKFLCRGKAGVKFCGHYERLQPDFDQVCSRLGLPARKLPRRVPSRNRKPGSYRQYYRAHPALVDWVGSEFAEDVGFGGYAF
jgi:hypothetical protein